MPRAKTCFGGSERVGFWSPFAKLVVGTGGPRIRVPARTVRHAVPRTRHPWPPSCTAATRVVTVLVAARTNAIPRLGSGTPWLRWKQPARAVPHVALVHTPPRRRRRWIEWPPPSRFLPACQRRGSCLGRARRAGRSSKTGAFFRARDFSPGGVAGAQPSSPAPRPGARQPS